jgi:hypothetical protein
MDLNFILIPFIFTNFFNLFYIIIKLSWLLFKKQVFLNYQEILFLNYENLILLFVNQDFFKKYQLLQTMRANLKFKASLDAKSKRCSI